MLHTTSLTTKYTRHLLCYVYSWNLYQLYSTKTYSYTFSSFSNCIILCYKHYRTFAKGNFIHFNGFYTLKYSIMFTSHYSIALHYCTHNLHRCTVLPHMITIQILFSLLQHNKIIQELKQQVYPFNMCKMFKSWKTAPNAKKNFLT